MKLFALVLSLGIVFLSGCETIEPRNDLPISKYEGQELEFTVIKGYVHDEVFVALDKSGWKEVARIPGYNGTNPSYVLMREKK